MIRILPTAPEDAPIALSMERVVNAQVRELVSTANTLLEDFARELGLTGTPWEQALELSRRGYCLTWNPRTGEHRVARVDELPPMVTIEED